ncbi:FAD/NAD(P)-binding domain-containing protein [Roridomyces roridus]|uniref:FAD/NAD(P)-binding domain-containing protein n=1 Tax=Roridomyces roridus TaxID=1738132 RepID=A0AAD7BMB0_9AGAR|nr:FAD/NAD(P)-binding domain-containing protein [Roridomyces roridus]
MSASSNNSQPLTISIVGAGIGGLTAAVALRRNGHNVQIFEAVEIKTEIGAAVAVQNNSLKVHDHIGVVRKNLHGVPWDGAVMIGSNGSEPVTYKWQVPGMKANGLLVHRSDLYEELKRLATGIEGQRPPAKLRLGTKVVACDPETATITSEDGEVVQADVLIGADGIHSVVRDHVLQQVVHSQDSGLSCFRLIFETTKMRDIPELEWLYDGVVGTRSVVSTEGPLRMLYIYPCRDGTLMNVVAFYSDTSDATAGWSGHATVDEFKTVFHDFHPKFFHLLDLPLHSPIHKWKLRVLPLLPTWVRGRTALLGDAAHATLPHLGQGAGMAVEDGGALGCLLPAGTRAEDVPARLKAYEELRKERGEFIRAESVDQMEKGFDLYKNKELQMKLLAYDPILAAQQFYQERFGGVN